MADDSVLGVVTAELRRYGIKPVVDVTGSGHRVVIWQLAGHPERRVVVPSTASDHRASLNARADVRRYIRADTRELLKERLR